MTTKRQGLLLAALVTSLSAPSPAQVNKARPMRQGPATPAGQTSSIVEGTRVVSTLGARASRVALKPGQFLATRVGDAPRVEIREQPLGMVGETRAETVTVLPFTYEGTTTGKQRVRLRPVIIPQPLQYRSATRDFRGSLMIALEDEDLPDSTRPLSGPVAINIASAADQVSPSELSVVHTNMPMLRVDISARDPRDSVTLKVIPNFDLEGVSVAVPVRATLLIANTRIAAAGLGVSTTPVSITVRGRALRDSLRVLVATDRGALDTNQLMIAPGASATVHLRSEGLGTATVTASALGVDGAEARINFTWPVAFVLMAVVGGSVGGITAIVSKKRRARTGLLRPTLVGALIGFVVAIVYRALNINLTGFALGSVSSDEAAVFALAILGGAFGIASLARTSAGRDVAEKAKGATAEAHS